MGHLINRSSDSCFGFKKDRKRSNERNWHQDDDDFRTFQLILLLFSSKVLGKRLAAYELLLGFNSGYNSTMEENKKSRMKSWWPSFWCKIMFITVHFILCHLIYLTGFAYQKLQALGHNQPKTQYFLFQQARQPHRGNRRQAVIEKEQKERRRREKNNGCTPSPWLL